MKQVDTRGLSCPQPVILVNREIKGHNESFEVLLDSEASLENVARILERYNLKFNRKDENGYSIYTVNR